MVLTAFTERFQNKNTSAKTDSKSVQNSLPTIMYVLK